MMKMFFSHEKYRSYNVDMAKILGGIEVAILLNDLMDQYSYFQEQGTLASHPTHGDGLMYYTIEKAYERCAMNKDSFNSAIRKLEKLGFIQKFKFGLPCKIYYRIKEESIAEWLFSNNFYSLRKPANCLAESRKPCSGIPQTYDTYNEPYQDPINDVRNDESSVVVSSSDEEIEQKAEGMVTFLKKSSEKAHVDFFIPKVDIMFLMHKYGCQYVIDQFNYMIKVQRKALDDEKTMKSKKTKPVGKPEVYLRMACEKNWGRSSNKTIT